MVQVTAENGAGAQTALSATSKIISENAPTLTLQFGSSGSGAGEMSSPYSEAIDGNGNIWVADSSNNRVDEFSSTGTFIEAFGWGVSSFEFRFQVCKTTCRLGWSGSENGEFYKPWGIAVNRTTGNIYVSDSLTSRIQEFNSKSEFVRSFGESGSKRGQLGWSSGLTVDAAGNVWVADYEHSRLEEFGPNGTYRTEITGHGLSKPTSIATIGERLYTTNYSSDKIQEFTTAGELVTEWGSAGSGEQQFSNPYGIAIDPTSEDVYIADCGNNRIEQYNHSGGYITAFTSSLSCPSSAAVGAAREIYVDDSNNARIQDWKANYSLNNPQPEPPTLGSTATWTADYEVPLTITHPSVNLSKEEVEKWGQKDYPVEGMAIFPPDEPQAWPASEYKRATITYLDEDGRTVNVATSTGGVSTTEYNSTNDVIRTLTPDNRAAALKEGCVSVAKKECKSAETAALLDTETEYNSEGNEELKVVGPQHKVKLASKNNEEVSARDIKQFFYDEGAPENGETYRLVTRTTDGALLGSGEEKDVRTTTMSYHGQSNLGWKLRKPTAVTTDPAGLDLTKVTEYDENTGNVIETKMPAGTSEAVYPPVYSTKFGSEGSGSGQFKTPKLEAFDATGNLWVADMGNNRIEKFNSSGTFLAAYGTLGSGNEQLSSPWAVAIDPKTGYLYVSDTGNNRIQELESNGKYIRTIGTEGSGKLKEPMGATIDGAGNLWVADKADNRIVEYSSTGTFEREVGTFGSGNGQFNAPSDIAISEGSIYVVDAGNDRIQQFSPTGAYLNQFGSKGSGTGQFSEPLAITVNQTTGDLYISDMGNNRTVEASPAGKPLVEWQAWSEAHQLSTSRGLAISSTGTVYMTNGSVVSEWTLPEAGGAHLVYNTTFGSTGSGEGQFSAPAFSSIDGSGNIWITDYYNDRVQKFSAKGKYLASYGKEGSGENQFNHPLGIAVNQSTGNLYIADNSNNRIEEISSTGTYIRSFGTTGSGELNYPEGVAIDTSGNVWVADTHHNRIVKYTSTGTYLNAYGAEGTNNGQFSNPADIAFSGTNLYITDRGNHRVQELSPTGEYIRQFGTEGSGSGELYTPQGIAADPAGNLYITDEAGNRIEEFSPTGNFRATFGTEGNAEGQLNKPYGLSIDAAGDMYVADSSNNRIEQWANSNQAVHDTKTTYYTPEGEAETSECRNHPEWANLPCQTTPDAQPTNTTASAMPTITQVYNTLDEVTTTTEAFPANEHFSATTRTKTETYDTAGRALTSEETATTGTSQPTTTNKYNSETGALEEQSTKEGATKIIDTENTLGQLVSYTDADGSTTKYLYDIDGRTEEVSDPKGTQNYAYDAKTGLMTKLVDSGAGTFTATYDVEGQMLTEGLPDGLLAKYTYNATAAAVGIEYEKKAHCEKTCPENWFSDAIVPSVHGETITQTSSLSNETYTYDATGRLTETQEITPSAKICKARLYAYDEESNRLSQTNRESSTETCPTEGGTVEKHVYDAANRLIDGEVTYDALGNETKLPATDAGKYELKSTFYNDGQVTTQTQHEQTIEYFYDPSGRTRETVSKGASTYTNITHYAGPGEAISWINEGSEKWSRNIPGIDGALDAIQSSTGTTTLQIHDLQGNIVGQTGTSETETKLQSSFNNTEFGVPTGSKTPAKYAWLGASGVKTEFETGIATEGGASYVPQIGRRIQTASVVPPGAFPDGSGPGAPEETVLPGWISTINEKESAAVLEEWAAFQEAIVRASITASDPAPLVYHLTDSESFKLAENIAESLNLEKEMSIAGAFIDPEGSLEQAIVDFLFPKDKINEYDAYLANRLIECLHFQATWEALLEGSPGCRVSEPSETYGFSKAVCFLGHCIKAGFSITVANINIDPEVSACLEGDYYNKGNYKIHDCFLMTYGFLEGEDVLP